MRVPGRAVRSDAGRPTAARHSPANSGGSPSWTSPALSRRRTSTSCPPRCAFAARSSLRRFAQLGAAFRWPLHGDVAAQLRDGRLELGTDVLLAPHVLIAAHPGSRVRIGEGTFLNFGSAVAAIDRVEIGAHCLFGPGCFVADHEHRFDDHDRTINEQGMTSHGPVRIGDHVWCGTNVVVTSGVSIGDRCVIGANSVVTHDVPPHTIVAGVPARPIGRNEPRGADDGPRFTPSAPVPRVEDLRAVAQARVLPPG